MTRSGYGRILLGALFMFGAQVAQAEEWAPSETDKREALAFTTRWLALKDEGKGEQAYALFSPLFREKVAFADWNARLGKFRGMAGPVRERRIVRVTWFKDPPQADVPGVYAALEVHGGFERIPEHLEKVILYRAPGAASFSVLRNEVDYAPPKPAAAGREK